MRLRTAVRADLRCAIREKLLNELRATFPDAQALSRAASIPKKYAREILSGKRKRTSIAIIVRLFRATRLFNDLTLENRVRLIMSHGRSRETFINLVENMQQVICQLFPFIYDAEHHMSTFRFSETHKPFFDAIAALRTAGTALWNLHKQCPEYRPVFFEDDTFLTTWKPIGDKVPREKKQPLMIKQWRVFSYYTANEDLVPVRAHDSDAGWDIPMADEEVTIEPHHSVVVNTGIRFCIPANQVGLIKSRSGLASKHFVEVGAGVIDAGYRGEVKVILHNHGQEPITLKRGDRVAQIVVLPINSTKCRRVRTVEELGATDRSTDGFGSTGLAAGDK